MAKNFQSILKVITVEPATLFYFIAEIALHTINSNLYIQKSCRFDTTIEPDLSTTKCDDETLGQTFELQVKKKYLPAASILCIIYTMLATSWSDETGQRRKPIIFLPIIGLICQGISGSLNSYFWHWTPMVAVLSNIIFEVVTGGFILFGMATQIYICNVSDKETRTMRLGLLWAVKTVCLPLGYGSAGFLIHYIGFFKSYLLCTAFAIISLILAVIFVKDVSVSVSEKPNCWQIFKLKRIVDSFKVIFKRDLGRKRLLVFLMIAIYVCINFTINGEKGVFYLFVRKQFDWDERRYSEFMIYKYVGIMIGTIFCSVIMSRRMKIHDAVIGIFAAYWDTIAVIGYLWANQDWHFYIVPLFDIFHGTALSVSVSFLSKFYNDNEFGRLNTVLMVFSLLIVLSHPTYGIVYEKTMDFFPSAFFLISVVLNIGTILLYCSSYIISLKMGI